MKIKTITIDGKEYLLGKSKPKNNSSKLHKKALELIQEVKPNICIMQEVSAKIDSSKPLVYIDIFLPMYMIAIEIQGKQHEEFTSHYHKDRQDFFKAKYKDSLKKVWCELNNINLIELWYNEKIEEWKEKITLAINN